MNEGARILLVEDDERDVALVMMALAECHPADRIAVARNGVEALDYLYRRGGYATRAPGDPLVVLLDLKLPKVDGLEVLRQVKGDDRLRCIPIVVLTSSLEERDVRASYELGANAYVAKAVDFHAFVDALKQTSSFWTMINQPPP